MALDIGTLDIPPLSPTTRTFPSSYGARAIALSDDQRVLFVGCKDGSVIALDLFAAYSGDRDQRMTLRSGPRSGVRCIYPFKSSRLTEGALLIGDDLGVLILLEWKEGRAIRQQTLYPSPGRGGEGGWLPVTSIYDWGEETLLVSYRNAGAHLVRLSEANRRIECLQVLEEAQGICGILRWPGRPTLLIAETGELWSVSPEFQGLKSLWHCCEELEQPGFVSDSVPVILRSEPASPGVREELREVLYLSTDTGLYQLYWDQENEPGVEDRKPKIEKVHLPGLTGMCMAVSYLQISSQQSEGPDRLHFLWVSDLAGDVHMFWTGSGASQEKAPLYWDRFGFRLESSQATRSIASASASSKAEVFAICQTGRKEEIVVTWYETPSLLQRPADLLAWGSPRDLLAFSKAPIEKSEWERWEPEAQLATCIEVAGRKPDQFAQFLASPHPERLAWRILLEIGPGERAQWAVILWTDALLGTVHRRLEQRREQQCLGVVRWLRRLAQCCREKGAERWARELLPTIEECIRHARKWGVFGGTYSQREEVFAPLRALERKQVGDRRLDRIAYQALLFGRKLDVEHETPMRSRGNGIPWDVRFLASGGKAGERDQWGFIAVSWGGGGIDLYRMASPPPGSSNSGIPELEFLAVDESLISDHGPADRQHDRSLILSRLPGSAGKAYLLRSTTTAAGAEDSADDQAWIEHFQVAFIGSAPPFVRPAPGGPLPEGESVYSLEEMSPGLVLVGLKGVGGKARLALVRISEQGTADLLQFKLEKAGKVDFADFLDLPSAYPELGYVKLNPIWSLACAGPAPEFDVIAGCGDGQIWKLRLKVALDTFEQLGDPVLVGRLGAPVRAVAYRRELARVIAGGADGTILAFQAMSRDSRKEAYATLWATWEQGVISRIHTFETRLGDELRHLILAVTQKGMAILFSDREAVKAPEEPTGPHRVHIPGERLGRLRLSSTTFASTLIKTNPEVETDAEKKGRVVRLLVATGTGTLRLLTTHYPKYTRLRHDQFLAIQQEWRRILRNGESALRGQLLRRTEALYAAAPHLATLLVRWILSPALNGNEADGPDPVPRSWIEREITVPSGPARQWLPWHLQHLVDFDAAWVRLATVRKGTESLDDLKRLAESFIGALRAAREAGDPRLFKEILDVTLKRANRDLFWRMDEFVRASREGVEPPSIRCDWFIALLNCLKDLKGAWLGAPQDLDIRTRIIIARNLVDGDTLLSLSRAFFAAAGADAEKWLPRLVEQEVELMHSFLAHGDPLLSLEVLRAMNFSLMRACRGLEAEEELNRGAIEGFFQAIGDFASRAVHSARNELGEALAHELWRFYALGMIACPSLTLRLTHRMSEAALDFAGQVNQQFSIISQLLPRSLPPACQEIFAIASGLRLQGEFEDYKVSLLGSKGWQPHAVGEDNDRLYREGKVFDDIVGWLHQLADQFSNKADDVDLRRVTEFLGERGYPEDADEFRHSWTFWRAALAELEKELKNETRIFDRRHPEDPGLPTAGDSPHESRPQPVRPDLVLFSKRLSSWCRRQRDQLTTLRRNYQIFDPQRMVYDRALARLQRVTESFREGAALQKNMVLGVLGHGLLEMLDEHLLGLWEVAQALDPPQTWDREDHDTRKSFGPRRSRKQKFADAMLNTAFHAEVIPKNLRNLQWLLCYRTQPLVEGGADSMSSPQDSTLGGLLNDFRKDWKIEDGLGGPHPDPSKFPLEVDECHFLRFVLSELEDNRGHNPDRQAKPVVRVVWEEELIPRIDFRFACRPDGERRKYLLNRFRELYEKHLQEPIKPDRGSCSRSHGTGLYLANLAAAAVGWELGIREPEELEGDGLILPLFLIKRDHQLWREGDLGTTMAFDRR